MGKILARYPLTIGAAQGCAVVIAIGVAVGILPPSDVLFGLAAVGVLGFAESHLEVR